MQTVKELEDKLKGQSELSEKEVLELKDQNDKYETDQHFLEKRFEQIQDQMRAQMQELRVKDQLILDERSKGLLVLEEQAQNFEKEKDALRGQMNISNLEKNTLKDEKHTLEEDIDKLYSDIISLERELSLARDEVSLRKSVVDSMGENLLKHESESM